MNYMIKCTQTFILVETYYKIDVSFAPEVRSTLLYFDNKLL